MIWTKKSDFNSSCIFLCHKNRIVKMKSFLDKLIGGDLRSIGRTNEVVNEVKNQHDFDILFEGLYHQDRKIKMRTADAIEKITLLTPTFLATHKKEIVQLCSQAEHIELKWHLALLVSRLPLKSTELNEVWRRLAGWAMDKKESKIVRVNSLQSLSVLSKDNKVLLEEFELMINKLRKENIPSLNARIKKIQSSLLPSSAMRTILG